MAEKKWIQAANLNKGALHRALGIAQDKPIPAAKLEKATHSKNERIRKMAQTAQTLKKLH